MTSAVRMLGQSGPECPQTDPSEIANLNLVFGTLVAIDGGGVV